MLGRRYSLLAVAGTGGFYIISFLHYFINQSSPEFISINYNVAQSYALKAFRNFIFILLLRIFYARYYARRGVP